MLRTLLLIHRYVGVAMCLLFAMWFASGMVMMYVGFPQLTAVERFNGLAPLDLRTAQVLPSQALAVAGIEGWPRALRIEMVLGRPAYVVQPWDGPWHTVFADDGAVLPSVEPAQALAAVQQSFGASWVRYLGQIERDQWTVPNSFNAYRPLHHIALDDAAGTEVYVSDRTGEIVRDTTQRERFWNWCGAVLHWVYFTELRQDLNLWRQVVLWIAGIGMVVVFTGLVVGVVRWRPRARYRHGSTSPYHGMMRWHHVLGLAAAVPLSTWIVSGWLSLEPFWASGRTLDRAMHERYTALDRPHAAFTITPAMAWQAAAWQAAAWQAAAWQAASMHPPAKEVRLQFWQGQPLYVFAAAPDQRLRIRGHESPTAVVTGSPADVAHAAQRLLPAARLVRLETLQAYDFYWYAHHTPRPLPVLRLRFDDPHATWLHIDPVTGDVLERMDASRRFYRIFFNALHSLDFPVLIAYRPAWDLLVLALCTLGLALSLTAVVIAWRRVDIRGRRSPNRRSPNSSGLLRDTLGTPP